MVYQNQVPLWMKRLVDIECRNTQKYGESANKFNKEILDNLLKRLVFLMPKLKGNKGIRLWLLSKSIKSDDKFKQELFKYHDLISIIKSVAAPVLDKALQKILKPQYIKLIMTSMFADYDLDLYKTQDEIDGTLENMLSRHSYLIESFGSSHSFYSVRQRVTTTLETQEDTNNNEYGDDESKGNNPHPKTG